ncbi:DUF3093 domain-containing protein [Acidipropionibacterium acidipropionici]|uniref:DUF3093 domain-containing protein n=1 Tax=Acidipropionibacterium acidipropionici TaxID=1748 RepID=UPI0009EDC627|nr:DUF3093 domain-containing protein [Acidipropionibacterium acidipropionici]AZP37887.1 DUF3093 domain-containing protein [Acidipropionibacterium acidipropionici]QCV95125.1 DUF3093 domain-containing protein [Acidipropionibacterium acidipropionici]
MASRLPTGSRAAEAAHYTERMWMSWWWWLLLVAVAGSMILAVAAWVPSLPGALACAAIAALSLWAGLAAGRVLIRVDAEGLGVGPNRIEWRWVDRVRGCDAGTMSTILHSGHQVGSFICTRPWIGTGVVLRLADPADPHPAWILSSRHPERLADAIGDHLNRVSEATRPAAIIPEERR